jgi:hypothetical protein
MAPFNWRAVEVALVRIQGAAVLIMTTKAADEIFENLSFLDPNLANKPVHQK